ncbi:MAG TPA: hypothetical protein PLL80_01760 [Candidatus Pacearchaeota archaeon]|nr:hypothetical protein [Candidatus Pacearchaeota archaeon]HOK94381.1 hypothetical protein [Candidatus Pacearchaeota archaeon]HPO75311.1 hypothetical protein [Candidatus Pacearchaeota archaeon]
MDIKSPLFIGLFLIIALVMGVFFTIPGYQEWSSFSKEVNQLQLEIKNQDQYFNSLKNISEELKNYEDKVSKINAALPDDPSLSSLGAFFNEKASQNGLILNELIKSSTIESKDLSQEQTSSVEEGGTEATTSTQQNKVVKETTLTLILTGPYPSLRTFLIDLERSARLIEIEEVSLSSSETGEGIFNFNLRLKVYSY